MISWRFFLAKHQIQVRRCKPFLTRGAGFNYLENFKSWLSEIFSLSYASAKKFQYDLNLREKVVKTMHGAF